MSSEDRMRRALHDHAEHIEPAGASWEQIQSRAEDGRRRRRRAWAGGATGAVAAAVLAVVGLLAQVDNGDQVIRTGTAAVTTSTTMPDETNPEVPAVQSLGIWPLHTSEDLDRYLTSGSTEFDDPAEVARSFAVDYLGMVEPVVGEATGPDPDGTIDVVIQPRGEGGATLEPGVLETTVHLDPEGPPWSVLSASSSNIRLDDASLRNDVSSPITVAGEATAFEGTVQVEVRQAGMGAGEFLGRDVVTAAQGTFAPFSTDVVFTEPTAEGLGALVLFTDSALDGSTLEATVVPLSFADDQPDPMNPATMSVTVFFHRGETLADATRAVPVTSGVLRASLDALLAGPTPAERDDGLSSWFSEATAGVLNDVTIDGEGRAVVDLADLRPIIPNASTSAGSERLLAELDATVFQFPTVTSVEYRIDGNCEAFWNWLQRSCEVVERGAGSGDQRVGVGLGLHHG